MREARHESALNRLARGLKPKAWAGPPRLIDALKPFLWFGGAVVFRLSGIMRRRQRKRREKEKQRRKGGRAFQLRQQDMRSAKHAAKTARLKSKRGGADRQPTGARRSPPRSTPKPPQL